MTQNSINNAASILVVDNLTLDGNTIISTDTDGDINLTPDGSGSVVISDINVAAGEIDGTTVGSNSASTGDFTAVVVDNLTLDGNTLSSTDTNGNIVSSPDGTGTVSVTTAPIVPTGDRADSLGSATLSWDNVYCDGVTFDDGSNVLAAYATSTWTPVISFGGASVGVTYSQQLGEYTRIGNVVFYLFSITLTSKGSSTGFALVSGLPFTSNATTAPVATTGWSSITFGGTFTVACCRVLPSTTTVQVSQFGANTTFGTLSDTEFADASLLTANGFYYV